MTLKLATGVGTEMRRMPYDRVGNSFFVVSFFIPLDHCKFSKKFYIFFVQICVRGGSRRDSPPKVYIFLFFVMVFNLTSLMYLTINFYVGLTSGSTNCSSKKNVPINIFTFSLFWNIKTIYSFFKCNMFMQNIQIYRKARPDSFFLKLIFTFF